MKQNEYTHVGFSGRSMGDRSVPAARVHLNVEQNTAIPGDHIMLIFLAIIG